MLIAFEGGDRCGKTTQIALLAEYLKTEMKMQNITILKHPNRSTPSGSIIDAFLKREIDIPQEAMTLCLTSNLWETHFTIEAELARGNIVLVDRYIHTNLVYSQIRGTKREKLEMLMKGIKEPDLVFYLRPNVIEGVASRTDFGKERYESLQIQTQVIKNFDAAFEGKANICVIDSSQSIEQIATAIASAVKAALTNKNRS